MLRLLQQAVVNVQWVSGPELQVQLQHDGFGVLGVQQPGAPQLGHRAAIRPEKIRGGKGAIEVPQTFPTGGVGATELIGSVRAVPGPVAAQGGRQTPGGLDLGAREGAKGAEAGLGFGGGRGAAAFIGGIAAFILTVALPGVRKTLPVPTEEFIWLTAALTQVTCRGKKWTNWNFKLSLKTENWPERMSQH